MIAATHHVHTVSPAAEIRAFDYALSKRGDWYLWGGAGPREFDCSGLVMASYNHIGIHLPHNTFAMIHSGKLVRVYHPRKGDLAFFEGGEHVEFYDKGTVNKGVTYGAHHTGTRIGFVSYNRSEGWAPWRFYRVR